MSENHDMHNSINLCPFCGARWYITRPRRTHLKKDGHVVVVCSECGRKFDVKKKDVDIPEFSRYGRWKY